MIGDAQIDFEAAKRNNIDFLLRTHNENADIFIDYKGMKKLKILFFDMSDLKKALFLVSSEKYKLVFFAFLFLFTALLEMMSIATIGLVISKLLLFTGNANSGITLSNNTLTIMNISNFFI